MEDENGKPEDFASYEETLAEARARYLKVADALTAKAHMYLRQADDLRRKATLQEASFPPPENIVVGDWKDWKIGKALRAYMKQLNTHTRIPVSDVANALLRAGVRPGKSRLGVRTAQETMMANIKKSAPFQKCEYDNDEESCEIWRIS
jgi:hypothetical protein